MHKLHRRLPDRRDHRTVPTRRPPLHLLFTHRIKRRDPGGVPPRDRQPHLRLRRLPRRLPVEPLRRRRPLNGAAPARRPWPSRLDRVTVAGRRRFPGQVSRHTDETNQAPRRAAKRLRGAGQHRRRHSTPSARARRCRPRAPHRRARPMGPWPSAPALRSGLLIRRLIPHLVTSRPCRIADMPCRVEVMLCRTPARTDTPTSRRRRDSH